MVRKNLQLGVEFQKRFYEDAAGGLDAVLQDIRKEWNGSARTVSKNLKTFLTEVAQEIADRNSNPWPGGTTEKSVSKRSGRLVNAIVRSVKVSGTTLSTIEGTMGGPYYATIQEFGATITPKSADFLAIPLPAALDDKGLPIRRKPRDWDNTFVARTRRGNLVIFQKRLSQIVPLYVLKASVRIPPRLGMRRTLRENMPRFMERLADDMIAKMRRS